MKRSSLAISSLRPLVLALAVLLAAGGAWGQTPWTKYEDNPVLEAGEPGEWDQGGVASGAVLFDGTTYHMWYGGFSTDPPVWPDADIGYATSPDGVTWTKHPGNPVLVRQGTWDSAGIFPGAVVWDGALYHMWYIGGTSASFTQTGYATSPDGVTWTPYPGNPVLRVGDPGSWDEDQAHIDAVIAEGGIYHAWYSGSAPGSSRIMIGYAASTDGVTWTKHPEPVLSPEFPGWDGSGVGNASVVFDGTYHMWYRGGASALGIGHAASSDGIHWVRQPADEPVLPRGAGTWDSGGVDLPEVVLIGDTAHMWYTGWIGALQSVAIGYATAPRPSPDARESFLPAAAVAAGAQGAFFVTEVEINNGGTEEAEVVFYWLPRGEDNSDPLASDTITLAAGQSRRWEDALTELFGLGPDSLGALRLVASTESVIAMSRIYNLPPGETAGTFGQGLPAIRATEMIPTGVTKRIIFLSDNGDFRANVGCVNGIDAGVVVAIKLHDSEGVELETTYMMLPPYSNRQINGIFHDYAPMNGYVDVRTSTPAAWIYCYGSVLDNLTSDPTTVLPQ